MTIALTEDLLARIDHRIEDAGPASGLRSLEDRDYAAIRKQLLAARPRDVWVFAYGSLLWNPCFEFVEERPATVHGWHRRFSLWLTRWRGTRERPGLMLALDRGGSCRGVVYRLLDRRRTVVQLESRNIRDATLWRLQGKVAAYLGSLQSATVEIDYACEG